MTTDHFAYFRVPSKLPGATGECLTRPQAAELALCLLEESAARQKSGTLAIRYAGSTILVIKAIQSTPSPAWRPLPNAPSPRPSTPPARPPQPGI